MPRYTFKDQGKITQRIDFCNFICNIYSGFPPGKEYVLFISESNTYTHASHRILTI